MVFWQMHFSKFVIFVFLLMKIYSDAVIYAFLGLFWTTLMFFGTFQ